MIDARGSSKSVSGPAPLMTDRDAGPSGSGWPAAPRPARAVVPGGTGSGCHWYSAAPNTMRSTGPEKYRRPSNMTFTECALSWSLLTTRMDQDPSGRSSGYAVISRLPSLSFTSVDARYNLWAASTGWTHSLVITWVARYCGG